MGFNLLDYRAECLECTKTHRFIIIAWRLLSRKVSKALALRSMQEGLMASDVRTRLSDTLRDMASGTGQWMYYLDHDGDGETGDVIYCLRR